MAIVIILTLKALLVPELPLVHGDIEGGKEQILQDSPVIGTACLVLAIVEQAIN